MALLNYTTRIPASRTVEGIQRSLVKHGARSVSLDFTDSRISAVSFEIESLHGMLSIRLPADVSSVHRVLQIQHEQGKVTKRHSTLEHAERVAWRIIKDWLEAQMAILETEMVKMEQIFLPYIVTGTGKTVYEVMEGRRFLKEGG